MSNHEGQANTDRNSSESVNPVDDEMVIDLTDQGLQRQAAKVAADAAERATVIDLRDGVLEALTELAPTGRTIPPTPHASGRPPDLQEGLEVVVIKGGPQWDRAEEFVYETYLTLGYTEETRTHHVAELEEYRERSHFHLAQRADETIIGTVRTIFGHYRDLPVGKFPRIDFADDDPMCHMSSVVVDPAARSRGVIEHLYRSAWADGVRHGARTITGLSESWMLAGFRQLYCMPFVPSGVPEWYMGGEVIPIAMSTSADAMAQVARTNAEFWFWNLETLEDHEVEAYGFMDLTRRRLEQTAGVSAAAEAVTQGPPRSDLPPGHA